MGPAILLLLGGLLLGSGLGWEALGCGRRSAEDLAPAADFSTPDVEISLSTQEVDWELAPGKVIRAWAYDGQVPGRTIRV